MNALFLKQGYVYMHGKEAEDDEEEFHDSHSFKLGKTLFLGLTYFFVVSGEKTCNGSFLLFKFLRIISFSGNKLFRHVHNNA